MITDERLNQMDAEATTITARRTVAGLAVGTFVLELTAEVRRLRTALAAEVTARQAAERMYREDMGRDDDHEEGEPCEVCGVRGCDDTCGWPDCVHGLLSSGDDCPFCHRRGAPGKAEAAPRDGFVTPSTHGG